MAKSKKFGIFAALGLVAQLVEQKIENPCVGGSIPPRATKISVKQNANPCRLAFLLSGTTSQPTPGKRRNLHLE
jgi:hypothetical protein